jgi:DNA gyrase subunit A
MACNFLPHNLTEVATAINTYLDGQRPTLPGPDFPTGGTVINANDIPKIMETGRGSVKVRGNYRIEKQNIVFYEIPYGINTEALLNEIGEVSDKKEIEGISEVRDESNKKGLRLVIECDKGVNPESIVKKLFAKTDLQTSISYNQIALVDKVPTELNLKDCIEIYVKHNLDCIVKEARFDLDKAAARQEVVDGLLKALEDIDNIVALIKKSKSSANAVENLISTYSFTQAQAKAIVDMKLGKLAGLEKIELQEEKAELTKTINDLTALVNSEEMQKQTLKERLATLVKKYGDERRTKLINLEINPEDKEIEQVTPEDVVVIMTQNGNIKRVPAKSFKTQKRAGKGVKTADEGILATLSTNTIDALMAFTDNGKMYKLIVDNIPAGTNTSKGVNINTLISIGATEKVIAITSLERKSAARYVVFFTKQGLMKKTSLEEFTGVKRSTGIVAIKLKEGDSIANVVFMDEEDVILLTKNGMSIHFETKDIAAIGRNTSGVKTIKLVDGDEVLVGLPIYNKNCTVAIFTNSGYGKKVSIEDFPVQGRGGRGVSAIKGGFLAGAVMVEKEDNLFIAGRPNSICVSADDLPLISRTSQGNIVIKDSVITNVIKI